MLPKTEKKKILKPVPKEEIFSTSDDAIVLDLISKGFHVVTQTIVNGRLLYTFRESKSQIEKK